MREMLCPIWKVPATVSEALDRANCVVVTVASSRAGGSYRLEREAELVLERWETPDRAKLTSWLEAQRALGEEIPLVTMAVLRGIGLRARLSVGSRADRLLQKLSADCGNLSHRVGSSSYLGELEAVSESVDSAEVLFLSQFLESTGWFCDFRSTLGGKWSAVISVDGYRRIEKLQTQDLGRDQVFVAMWFDGQMDGACEAILKGIKVAGYTPLRIDKKDHNNKIDDEIIAEIRRSRFVVVDFTQAKDNARGGVYYEAGFAHGLGIPVIFCCRKNALEYVHFDTRQYNHIVWDTPEELSEELEKRICAVIGDGPHRGID